MKSTSDYKKLALQSLKGKWSMAAIVMVINIVISWCLAYIPTFMQSDGDYIMSFFMQVVIAVILWPLSYGVCTVYLQNLRSGEIEIGELFAGYKDCLRVVGAYLIMAVCAFLWTLLFIIPGCVKVYSYMLTPYILKDNPEIGCNAAINRSMKLMQGHKMDLFLLDLSFIGWAILSVITLGIGFLFLTPYVYTAHAHFYEDLLAEEEVEVEEETI